MADKTILDYWLILYRRRGLILLLAVVSSVTAFMLSKAIKPVYEAKTTFYIPESSQALPFMADKTVDDLKRKLNVPAPHEETYSAYIGLLKSRKIAELVNEEFPNKKISKLLISDVDFELTNEYFIKLYSRDNDPLLAKQVADAYVKYLNVFLQKASMENLHRDSNIIKAKREQTIGLLSKQEEIIKKYLSQNNMVSVDEEGKRLTELKAYFLNQLEGKKVLMAENQKKIRELEGELKKEGRLLSRQNVTLTNPIIEHLQLELSKVSTKISSASAVYTKKHPELIKLNSQYKMLSGTLEKEIQTLVNSRIKPYNTFYEKLRQDLVALMVDGSTIGASVTGYRDVLNRINTRLNKLPEIKAKLDRLYSESERLMRRLEQLEAIYQETLMQINRDIQFIIVVDKAELPASPSFPLVWLNVIVALLSGLLVGVVYALFFDYFAATSKIRRQKLIKAILKDS